jgi:PQQ-dependent dehydrogenase (methanol/ethanol family)
MLSPRSRNARIVLAAAMLATIAASTGHSAAGRRDAARPATVDAAQLQSPDRRPGDWMSYGRGYDEQRFSPLAAINDRNAGGLKLAWYADLGMHRGSEATPLAIDGKLYVSTAWSNVHAYDGATGRLLWRFDAHVAREKLATACCDVVNRGVAVWKGRVFVGTIDGRLIALDQTSGKPVWSVQTTPPDQPYTITGAPRVVRDLVIIGNGGAELGVRGFVSAYSVATGKRVWRFYTVPGDPAKPDGEVSDGPLAKAATTWSGDRWWRLKAGGGTAWDAFAYDPALDLLYLGTGNGSPWSRKERSAGQGDNLFLSSILAVRPLTGELVWHYQVTPGDEWDFTATQSLVLADLTIAGRKRAVIMQAPKNGFFYVLDRATGAPISAEKYVPVNWASRIDLATGRPVENPDARYSETGKTFYSTPGTLGGHNWPPMAFSPRTALVYIPAHEIMSNFVTAPDFHRQAIGYNTGTDFGARPDPARQPIKAVRGYLLAWDPVRQREAWRVPRDTFGNGGILATAGNLIVQGTGTGFVKAMRADTGAELWSFWAQTGALAAPITFVAGGKQYVAILAGCGGVYGGACELATRDGRKLNPDRLLVFALDGKAKLPPLPPRTPVTQSIPDDPTDPVLVARGGKVFTRYCGVCHGMGGVSLGNQPDLRFSAMLGQDAWRQIVLGGALKDSGMVSFASELGEADAESIRNYVIDLARSYRKGAPPPPAVANHSS